VLNISRVFSRPNSAGRHAGFISRPGTDTDDTDDGLAVFAGNMLILVGVREAVFWTLFIF
jgi:hypothetical protein